MCGLVGLIGLRGQQPEHAAIARIANLLQHRGPDNLGVHVHQHVGFGFRRLAILDLGHSGDQPMRSACGRFVIVFNGEIFNYVELREQLRQLGHRFRTASDTEVLLAAYLQWGEQCLDRLNGMWAFLIHDLVTGSVFGSRDRFGEKPLYVSRNDRWLMFASEIKAIRDSGLANLHVNWPIVAEWMTEQLLDHTDETFYREVHRVAAGSAFRVSANGEMSSWRYWSLDNDIATPGAHPIEEFAELFEDAVRLRTRSDVPVGVMLSGGMDSTSIACARRREELRTGAAGSRSVSAFCFQDAQYDESSYVDATLQQTDMQVHCLRLDERQLWSDFRDHLQFHDEPVHSAASVVGFGLMRLARQNKTPVVLGGQGADEVLGGYYDYYHDFWLGMLNSGRIGDLLGNVSDFCSAHRVDQAGALTRLLKTFFARNALRFGCYRELSHRRRIDRHGADPWFRQDLVRALPHRAHSAPAPGLKAALRRSVQESSLPLYLRIEDRNSMASSVEARLPFLDYRLVSFADKLAEPLKLRPPWNKWILRESMKGRIPEVVRVRLDKFGFPTPLDRWCQGPWQAPMADLLSEHESRLSRWINVKQVRTTLEAQKQGSVRAGIKLFAVAQLALWLSQCEESHVAV